MNYIFALQFEIIPDHYPPLPVVHSLQLYRYILLYIHLEKKKKIKLTLVVLNSRRLLKPLALYIS